MQISQFVPSQPTSQAQKFGDRHIPCLQPIPLIKKRENLVKLRPFVFIPAFWRIIVQCNGTMEISSFCKFFNQSYSRVFLQRQKQIVNYYVKKFVKESQQWKQTLRLSKKLAFYFTFCQEVNKNTRITENLWRTFWRDKWRSVFDVVQNFR